MPAPSISREEVVQRLLGCFQKHGYDGASLARLSRATSLGKSSLYHYFPGGKEDMARAVLDELDRWMAAHVAGPLNGAGSPRQRLERMGASIDSVYAGGKSACVLGSFTIGEAQKLFQKRLNAAFATWIDTLTKLAVEAGRTRAEAREWAEGVVVSIEGALIVSRGLGDLTPFRRALRQCVQTLAPRA